MVTALLYVQHLLGIGHLMRASALARGLEAAGIRVVLVSGGMPVPVLDSRAGGFEQLPPVRTLDESFKHLVDDRGEPVDDDLKEQRRARLLQIFDRERPDIVLTELYPFGRRQMGFELEPLLREARSRREQTGLPVIVSSVRDIIVASSKPGRTDEIIGRVRDFYDLVLVHGDESLIPFDRSFPRAADIVDVIRSTGYVVGSIPARQAPGAVGYAEVIVSTGGGAVSDTLLEAAIGARALCRLRGQPWRVLVGHYYPENSFLAFRAAAPRGVQVERARSDFGQLLANCALSISQRGYNTVAEILATGARAVCLPFAGGAETEQTLRCRSLAEQGVLQFVEHDAVSAEQVALAVDRALRTKPARGHMVDTNGAARSAALLLEVVHARKAKAIHSRSPS
jgi:predicted glycosyltransferase